MVLVRDARSIRFPQPHGQAKFERLALPLASRINALSYGFVTKPTSWPQVTCTSRKRKSRSGLLRHREKQFPRRHVGINPRERNGGGTSNIKISGS